MEWDFFDAILGARPAINPPAGQVLDTSNISRGSRARVVNSCRCQQRMYKNRATWMRNTHAQCDEPEEWLVGVGDAWPNI